MRPTGNIVSRHESTSEYGTKSLSRKLPLRLFELDPESGEEESVHVDLDLDQLED
jgi:hypothetical protein